jgi:WD40 repeat protein
VPNLVKVTVSKRLIKLIPDLAIDSTTEIGDAENEFDVTVINGSNKFASFSLELLAIGADANTNVKWYSLDPSASAKKPPGAQTAFHVIITKPPIQVYDATIDLTLRVFSVEHPDLFNSQKLSLKIEKPRKPLRLYLPVKELKVYPGSEIEIPAILYNLSQKSTDVKLTITGIHRDWFTQGTEQKLHIDAGDSEKTSFWCEPPKSATTLSQEYEFKVEAKSDISGNPIRESGNLEVLPQGTVKFSCIPKIQIIPAISGKNYVKKSGKATYELQFDNDSNLPQQVDIEILEKDKKQCDLVIPQGIKIEPGEYKPMYLVAKKRRPWLGLKQRLFFEVIPFLRDPDTKEPSTQIYSHPQTQILELQVLPIIPVWLQLIALLLLLLLLLLIWYLNPADYHTGPVNSVRLIGNGSLVASGSSDQTIRLWQVDRSPWQLDIRRLKYEGFIAQETQKSVRVIRQSPREDYVIASGLENGDIKLWNVLSNSEPKSIFNGNDRVFDLAFTKDSRYLFSGHGSGLVRQWNLETRSKNPRLANLKFTIYALAISENAPNPLVIVAGRYNKIAFWNWVSSKIYELDNEFLNTKFEDNFSPILGQNQYIDSLAIADDANIFASADNKGTIILWNLNKIRQCITALSPIGFTTNTNNNQKTDGNYNIISSIPCNDAILEKWSDGHDNQPVRSVAFTQNGCYLASVGDDGRVMLWILENGMRSPKYQKGKVIANFPKIRLNTVDLKAIENNLYITTGDDKNRVRLYHISGINNHDNSNCK